ncbi:hypothetical protein ACH5RR_010919 [Cinchona calisaya]|uniref:Protein kinase domain-containing protein n=1 Tax=Cinchona calisaya TaxID=153742 RepID=A0ABD3A986_9GENT
MINKEPDRECGGEEAEEEAALASDVTPSSSSSSGNSFKFLSRHHSSKTKVGMTAAFEPRLKCSVSLNSSPAENCNPTFSYRELAAATNNFRRESLIGEGGFGSVYKGKIESTGQVVAIKKLDPTGVQGSKEFLVEVLMLSLLRHPNLIDLVGFCAEGEQRLLIYEYLPLGSLEYHLHDLTPYMKPLDWNTRMKIAAGIAKGLDYLHSQADPPVIHRDLKSSNILLDEGFHPKLSDFGLAKFGPTKGKTHVSTRVMGTQGYCAPEYYETGKLTMKSDIYCFGIVLLEIITGRRAMDTTLERGQQTLLEWSRPLLKNLKDGSNLVQIADQRLKGQFSASVLCQAIDVALMCLRDESWLRPPMKDVVCAMNYLTTQRFDCSRTHDTRDGHGKDGRISREEGKHEKMTDVRGAEDASAESRKLNKDQERERAVAEAKLWAETCRAKMQLFARSEFDE